MRLVATVSMILLLFTTHLYARPISDEKMSAIQFIFENSMPGFRVEDMEEMVRRKLERFILEGFVAGKPELSKEELTLATIIIYDTIHANMLKLAELQVPIYDKYFTEQELWAYVEFIKSPAGRKYIDYQIEFSNMAARQSLSQQQVTELMAAEAPKRFTPQEVRSLAEYFESEAGKKWLDLQPQLAKEKLEAGQAWALETQKNLYETIKQRLRAEGIE